MRKKLHQKQTAGGQRDDTQKTTPTHVTRYTPLVLLLPLLMHDDDDAMTDDAEHLLLFSREKKNEAPSVASSSSFSKQLASVSRTAYFPLLTSLLLSISPSTNSIPTPDPSWQVECLPR